LRVDEFGAVDEVREIPRNAVLMNVEDQKWEE
jgi:hypothetical protein